MVEPTTIIAGAEGAVAAGKKGFKFLKWIDETLPAKVFLLFQAVIVSIFVGYGYIQCEAATNIKSEVLVEKKEQTVVLEKIFDKIEEKSKADTQFQLTTMESLTKLTTRLDNNEKSIDEIKEEIRTLRALQIENRYGRNQ